MRRLDLVVGPNGAGKSTFVELTLARALPSGTLFVNADEIAARHWPGQEQEHAYEAARLAAATRTALIAAGRSFIAETVFSHPSKVELVAAANDAGYQVHLHVLLVPVELSVARVAARVSAGGHAVPEDKIRGRYERLWGLVAKASQSAAVTVVYDNSAAAGPAIVARLVDGISMVEPRWPSWTPPQLSQRWPGAGG